MEHSTIQTVGVLGTGVIGASWTVLFLSKGLKVIASDPAPEAERKLRAFIDASWSNVCKADPAAPASPPHSALTFVDEWQTPFQGVDFVQENGPERLQYKEEVFRSLATSTRPGVVLASSSSGLPSSQYAGSQDGATRTLVGHPFNPPHLIPLVEVVPNSRTSSKAVDAAMHFYRSLDRSPVLVKGESPGFITNRLQAALVHEAYSLVSRGLISASDLGESADTARSMANRLTSKELQTLALAMGWHYVGLFRDLSSPSKLFRRSKWEKCL